VAERTDEMAQVQAAGRPHARNDTRSGVHFVGSQETMNRYGGTTMCSKPPVRMSAYSSTNPYGRNWLKNAASERGSRPASTLPPSSGGIGTMLNTASSTFS